MSFSRAGVPVDTAEEKNWPLFLPIIHHDIAKEIPHSCSKAAVFGIASWLGIVVCLVFNNVAVTVCWIKGGGVKIFFLAVIYALLGCPLSYLSWYRPLYRALRGILAAVDVFFRQPCNSWGKINGEVVI